MVMNLYTNYFMLNSSYHHYSNYFYHNREICIDFDMSLVAQISQKLKIIYGYILLCKSIPYH